MKFIDLKYFFHITRSCNRTHSNQQAPLEQRVPWDLLDLSTALDASRLYESSFSSYSDKPLLVATLTAVRKNSHSLNFGWQFATLLVFRGSIWFIYHYILILISVDINYDHVFLKRELVVEYLNDCGVWYHSIYIPNVFSFVRCGCMLECLHFFKINSWM